MSDSNKKDEKTQFVVFFYVSLENDIHVITSEAVSFKVASWEFGPQADDQCKYPLPDNRLSSIPSTISIICGFR